MGLEQPIVDLRARFIASIAEFRILTHIRNSFMNNESVVADLNADQMLEGLDREGNPIRPTYASPEYAALKQRLNPRPTTGTPDLRLTGAFQRKIFLRFVQDAFELDSTDEKTEELVFKYGDVIFGLTEESRQKIPELFLIDDIQTGVRQDLRLNGN